MPDAQLPQKYEHARHALAECIQIDECKVWSDKAAALASYARQAEDTTLMNHAMRIQARAVRRAGELLEAIEPSKGGYQHHSTTVGDNPSTRTDAAREAGLSEHQQKQAVRVARVPESEFNEAVESKTPPTVTALAQIGKGVNPSLHRKSMKAWGMLGDFSRWIKENPPQEISAGFLDHEILKAIRQSGEIRVWLQQLEEAFDVYKQAS